MKNFFTSIIIASVIFLNLNGITNAASITATQRELNAEPGGSYETTFYIRPTDHEIGREMSYTPVIAGINVSNSKTTVIEPENLDTEPWYSVSSWGNFDKGEVITADEQGASFVLSIDVPEDADPGTYYLGAMFIIVPNEEAEASGATNLSVVGRSVNRVTINVLGEGGAVEENLELKSFSLDENKYVKGDIVFLTEFDNESRIALIPTGTITLFDEEGKMIDKIVSIYEERADGTTVLTSESDEILLNPNNTPVEPLNSRTLITPWNNKTIALGKYTAKLEGYFGKEGKFEAELPINITEAINIADLTISTTFSAGEELQFSSNIQNIGNNTQTVDVKFEIKNLFGMTVFSDSSSLEVKSASVEKYETSWSPSLGLGWYSANLTIGSLTKSSTFYVIIWWQVAIALAVLVFVIYLIIHAVRKYSQMKAKLESQEKPAKKDE